MILDSGTMYICKLENTAENGLMPKEKLVPVNKHWFQERVIGLSRQALAQGRNERIDLLAYIHFDTSVRAGMYVVVGDLETGDQMRINSVGHIIEENTNLRYTNLNCQRLDKLYDVAVPVAEGS